MENVEKVMEDAMGKMAKRHEEEIASGIQAIAGNLSKGMLAKDALGVGDRNTEKLYAEAYQLYNIGKYMDAKKLFSMLYILDPTNPRYAFGIAASCQMLQEYDLASDWYVKSALFDPTNPIPHFHAADCYIKINDAVSAYTFLLMASKYAKDKPEFSVLKDRAEMMMQALKKVEAGQNIQEALQSTKETTQEPTLKKGGSQ